MNADKFSDTAVNWVFAIFNVLFLGNWLLGDYLRAIFRKKTPPVNRGPRNLDLALEAK